MQTERILEHFDLPAGATAVPVGTGLMNKTYRVVTQGGDFVLQKIHPVIPDAAADDMQVVTTYLAQKGMQVPRLVLTKGGKPFVRDAQGDRWRLYPWIPGRIVDALQSEAMAEEAGRVVGEMHKHLAELDYRPLGSIPNFHDTACVLRELRSVRNELPEQLHGIADNIIVELPHSILHDASGGVRQVIHADLKISNLVFDDAGKAVGVIDFDTLLWHYPAIDLGDAFRSWCNRTAEDDANAVFDEGIFAAAVKGYEQGVGGVLAEDDVQRFLRATKQITLELASRFLIDIVRDNYFGYDTAKYTTRREANIARALSQYHLATTIPFTP